MSYKYEETGFRPLYKNFTVFMLTDRLRASIVGFPEASKANCILVYGYIDNEAGLTLEVLAAGKKMKTKFSFFDGSDSIRSFIRIGAVAKNEFFLLDDQDGTLRQRYAEKIEALSWYKASEEIEKARDIVLLDSVRHAEYIDDVLVYLLKDGLMPEGCWTRITGLGERCFMGTLLNEPDQDFGCHLGEKIVFFAQKTEDKQIICYSDMASR